MFFLSGHSVGMLIHFTLSLIHYPEQNEYPVAAQSLTDPSRKFDSFRIWALSHENISISTDLYIVTWATVVVRDPKVLFSLATTPRCRGGRYSFPWIVPLYPLSVPHNANTRRHQILFFIFLFIYLFIYWVFGMSRSGIELLSSGQLANTHTHTLFRFVLKL